MSVAFVCVFLSIKDDGSLLFIFLFVFFSLRMTVLSSLPTLENLLFVFFLVRMAVLSSLSKLENLFFCVFPS